MSLVGVIAILISFAAIPITLLRRTLGRILLALGLLVAHLGATLMYYSYVLTNTADTAFYYNPPPHFTDLGFGLSTIFVVQVTQWLKNDFGATYLDTFMVFQTLGFWGIMLLLRIFDEIYQNTRSKFNVLPMYILFLPSVHFWTTSIGKDGPIFFGSVLTTWAVMNLSRRVIVFICGLGVMVLFRAHIALITVMALAIAAIMHGRMTVGRKVMLLAATVATGGMLTNAVNSSFSVDVTSAASLSDFFIERDTIAGMDLGNTSIGNAPFFVRLFALLFRPLFIDAHGLWGLVPSVENVGSVLLFGYLALNYRHIRAIAKRVFFVRYVLTVSIVLILLLALMNYNVGLGLRQRVMVFPPLFSLFVASWALRPRRREQGYGGMRPILPLQQTQNEPVTGVLGARMP